MSVVAKILLVDDRPENLFALEKVLTDFSVEIIKANSGNEALELSITHEFALVLMDVQMPGMDGYETVRLMRNVKQTQFLPVIFISAIYSDDHYKIQGIEAGAVDFITKPINSKILQGKVQVFLDLYLQHKLLEMEIEQRKQIEKELKNTEQELNNALLKAEESDRLKTAFLANMSHEIRTPLNAIVGFSNLLAETDHTPEKRKKYITYINNSSESLTSLISDIIDTAKIEAGQLEIVKSTVDIFALLSELYETTLVYLDRIQKSAVLLQLSLPENLSAYSIVTDGLRLKQVMANLLTNACKFTYEGQIDFGFTINDARYPEFFVNDTGVGITDEQQLFIFEMFRQVPQDETSKYSGTGLGLSIVKKLVELLGGKIELESRVGVGSTFRFSVQTKEVNAIEPAYKRERKEKVHATTNSKQVRILIAEDHDINYELLKAMLPLNWKHTWAKNGQEAIERIHESKEYDIILMDLKMPQKSGYDALSEIRVLAPHIPIVAQTAYAMAGEKDAILNFGFDAYVAKPIRSVELFEIIERLTNKVRYE